MNQIGRITAFFNGIKTSLGFNQTKLTVAKTRARVSKKAKTRQVKARAKATKRKSVRKRN